MTFPSQDSGSELGNYETNDDLFSSNYDSDAEDCYIEALKAERTVTHQGTTITKLKKDGRASFSSFEAPLTPPRRRSEASTISSTSLVSASSSLPSCFASSTGQRRKMKKKKTKRSVRFSHGNEYYSILPRKEYTKKELKNCWYTKADHIKRDACFELLALRIEEKKPAKEDDTYRGLEDLMMELREKSENRRLEVVQAVLKAQAEHGSEDERVEFGVVDPIILAVTSMELSQDSKADALEIGMTDMLDVLAFTFEPKKQRRSLPSGEKLGTIIDPFPLPDQPRRYSAPAAALVSEDGSSKEQVMEALALFDDIDISTPPAPPVSDNLLTPESGKVKKRRNSATRRTSLDSSSKHTKTKSKSKSIPSLSTGKSKSNSVKSIGSPNSNHMRSPVKKKAKSSISNDVQAAQKKKDESKSGSSSTNCQRPNHDKPPSPSSAASGSSSSTSQVASPSKKQTRKRLVSNQMQSPRSSVTKENSRPAPFMIGSNSSGTRIHAPTPPRKDPPGMFHRIASIRLDDHYPPSVPRL
ncbi:unnamed protein product [Cylindrotheca closterium]|uniref:Uncharacterized protein n=1 Tax=Cylindrotheca closterium TaxID=2856 RepID=A0AAD2FED8_9STRA|nr:unnamed protein product [Cylindrotheca closterium]